jgi:hypothetical protein
MSTLPFQGGVIFRTFAPDSGFRTYMPCWPTWSFTLKQLRLPVLNKSHIDSYAGPRLQWKQVTNIFSSICVRHFSLHDINIVNNVIKSRCLKTLFSRILSWNDQEGYKNIKIAYLFHCPSSRKMLIKSKQIHFCVFLSRIFTWTCRCQKQLNLSKPKRQAGK